MDQFNPNKKYSSSSYYDRKSELLNLQKVDKFSTDEVIIPLEKRDRANSQICMQASDLNLAVIGNCTLSALINDKGAYVFCCWPQFDSDPIFCSLLNGCENSLGLWEIDMVNFSHSEQTYITNTAIVITRVYATDGSAFEITDFAPRYVNFGRTFRPSTLVRLVKPIAGQPRIIVRFRPASGYGLKPTNIYRVSVQCVNDVHLRLTTEIPVSFIMNEIPFNLTEEFAMILANNEPLMSSIKDTAFEFYDRTFDWWNSFSRALAVPYEWQDAVIRSAITLKLCQYEESGAILAAMTTSIPEDAGSCRNWDYRFCWLRDSFHTVRALNRLSETKTMEAYIRFISNIAIHANVVSLQPVYGILFQTKLTEYFANSLEGYRGLGPVRVGNYAYEQNQNDSIGNIILATVQSFVDMRVPNVGNVTLFATLESLGEQALKIYDTPDAGIWEFRGKELHRVHTFSAIMCWVACDRLSFIAKTLNLNSRVEYWRNHAVQMKEFIMKHSWNEKLNSFVTAMHVDSQDVDACLLLIAELKFIEALDPKFISTVDLIAKRLKRGLYLFRYTTEDDFGMPRNAFNICTFWYIEAIFSIGRKEEAREIFVNMLAKRNKLGILSEDLDVETAELWGNYPQTYSMCGIINSAVRLSKSWEEFGL